MDVRRARLAHNFAYIFRVDSASNRNLNAPCSLPTLTWQSSMRLRLPLRIRPK
jgi:hypothetical protein